MCARTHQTPASELRAGFLPLRRVALYKRLHAALIAKGGEVHNRAVGSYKHAFIGPLRGRVLEVGPGAGANLRYLAPDVHWVGVEPNPYMHAHLRREAARLGREVELRTGTAEELPAEDASFDAVVATLVLCTVHDVPRALAEVRRVLKPAGRFVFVEHIAAPAGSFTRRVQRVVRPLWAVLGDGCRPDRETAAAVAAAGFGRVELTEFRVPLPVIGPHVAGRAER